LRSFGLSSGTGKPDEKIDIMYTYQYPRPALTVDALVFARKNETWFLLLVQRGNDPFKGMWALPGGFADLDETLEEACRRELEEETGLKAGPLNQFRVFDAIGRDPRHRTITLVFYTFTDKHAGISGGDDAADAAWFPVNSLPTLAFDHAEVVRQFLQSGLFPE